MKPCTLVSIQWHEGIPDGKRKLDKIVEGILDFEELKDKVLDIFSVSSLSDKYSVESVEVQKLFGDISICKKNDDILSPIAQVKTQHYLEIGNRYFTLTEAFPDSN